MKLKFMVIALSILFLQTGCTLLLLGGTGAGDYYVGKDGRSGGQTADDAAITSSINAKLIKDKYINTLDVSVHTYNNVVTLNGHVSQSSYINRSISLAKSVGGVKRVISNLTVTRN